MLFACHVCCSRTGCNCAEAWSLSSATLSRPCYSCSQRGPQGKRFTLGTKSQSVHAMRWCPRGEPHYHGAAGLKQCMHYILAVQNCKLTSSQSFQPSYCWWIFNLISTWRIICPLYPLTHTYAQLGCQETGVYRNLREKKTTMYKSVFYSLDRLCIFCTFLFATQQSNLLRSYLIFTFPIKNSQWCVWGPPFVCFWWPTFLF